MGLGKKKYSLRGGVLLFVGGRSIGVGGRSIGACLQGAASPAPGEPPGQPCKPLLFQLGECSAAASISACR